MKAIRVHEFGPPEVMKLEDVPDPAPGRGQVVVRVYAAGVNPVETYIRSGAYANKPPLPYTPGGDAAGVVAAVGAQAAGCPVGARVYTAGTVSGAYAQLALCDAVQVHPLPDHLTFAQGAALHVPYATAYRALFDRAHACAGQTVLVHGASGGVGLAAVQFAAAAGLTVFGTAGTDRGRLLVLEEGAAHVFDHKTPGYLDELLKLTDGRGVDLILEMLANVNLGKDLTVLAKGGGIVVIGSRGEVQVNPRLLMRAEGSILGVMGGSPRRTPGRMPPSGRDSGPARSGRSSAGSCRWRRRRRRTTPSSKRPPTASSCWCRRSPTGLVTSRFDGPVPGNPVFHGQRQSRPEEVNHDNPHVGMRRDLLPMPGLSCRAVKRSRGAGARSCGVARDLRTGLRPGGDLLRWLPGARRSRFRHVPQVLSPPLLPVAWSGQLRGVRRTAVR